MKTKINNILYATDLSPNSGQVFRYALRMAVDNNAKIFVLHVIEDVSVYNPIILGGYISEDKLKQILDDQNSSALKRLEKRMEAVSRVEFEGNGDKAREFVAEVEIAHGFPAELILAKADSFDCDVIVMGTHGKGFISQTFLGSMAKRVLRRTRKPVFIVPVPEGESELTVSDDVDT